MNLRKYRCTKYASVNGHIGIQAIQTPGCGHNIALQKILSIFYSLVISHVLYKKKAPKFEGLSKIKSVLLSLVYESALS